MGLSLKTRFGFGYTARPGGLCLAVQESMENAGMRDSFGIAQLSAKGGGKRKYCNVNQKELEARRGKVCFPWVIQRILREDGETHMQ